jgi:flavin-dependent dehydrogenase
LSFDQYLVDLAREAGAALRLGDGVRRIDLMRNVVALSSGEEVGFRFLIGADGVTSIVGKTLFGRSFDPKTVALALEAEVPRERLPGHGDRVEFDFSAARWGYGWVFPKRDTLTVGIGGLQRLNSELRESLERYFRRKGLDARHYKVKGHFIPIGDPRTAPGRGNVLLCGDAAGAVDPLSGEGLHFAMQTGGAAGAAVADALRHPERDALAIYVAQFAPVARALRRGRFWCWFIYPRVMERVFAAALRWEPLRKRILTG